MTQQYALYNKEKDAKYYKLNDKDIVNTNRKIK